MTPFDLARVRVAIDELSNALQVVVLVAEHLERASSASAQDARTITRSLERVTGALQRIKTEGGAQ
jgi:cob(I)alamin adenosyltransferase